MSPAPQKATSKTGASKSRAESKASAKRTAAAKKTTAKSPTRVAARRSVVPQKSLERLKARLEEERATYVRQAEELAAEAEALAADREPGDIQFDDESGEGDTINVERERDLALSASARAAVEQIDAALERIRHHTYGICERCEKRIPVARLEAVPQAALCIECKSRQERRR